MPKVAGHLPQIYTWLLRNHYDTAMSPIKPKRIEFGRMIQTAREQRGMTCEDVADVTRFEPKTLKKANFVSIWTIFTRF